MKVGTKYDPEYVNRLASMVARHTTRPHTFVCFTDSPGGLNVPWAPIGTDLPGWWAKLALFQLGVRALYLDLDTIICGNIDPLFDYAGPFAILRSFLPPSRYGSAIMAWEPGQVAHIWERFTLDVTTRLHGDQDWIEEQMPVVDYWQDLLPAGTIGSYKVHDLRESSRGYSICCFHGEPKPHQVNGWVRDAWR